LTRAVLAFASHSGGQGSLSVSTFNVDEGVSSYFVASIVASSDEQVDLEGLIGQEVTFTVGEGSQAQSFPGICRRIEQVRAEPTGRSTYELEIVHRLFLLTQRRGYRVHQHLSAPDIAARVLETFGIAPDLAIDSSAYPKLPYKVQYDETDHAFFCRVLEEAGIAFTTSHGEDGALTLADALHAGDPRTPALPWVEAPNPGLDERFVSDVRISREVRPGALSMRDYDFRRPALPLSAEEIKADAPEDGYEQVRYDPGSFLKEVDAAGGATPVADRKGAARHDEAFGKVLAERALGAIRTSRAVVAFRTSVLDLAPGVVFEVENHPHTDLGSGKKLLVVQRTIEGDVTGDLHVRSRAVFADVDQPYRPQQVTPKPIAEGVQTATVVGEKGQEIDPDEFGRVLVQFPWDREGQSDDRSSCWLRVSQGWAGTGFGFVTIPRVGQEVLVGFLEGDPDQPIVVGRVFNQTNPVPYALPEHKTRSTWKSQSSPKSDGFNEILFEDLAGAELVFMQAQRDLRKLVKNDEVITVGNDRQKLVKANEIEKVGANRSEVTGGDRLEITHKSRTTIIGTSRAELVGGDAVERIEGELVRRVGDDLHLTVRGSLRELVEKDAHRLVRGERQERVGGTYGLSAGSHQIACGSQAVGAGGTIHMKAGASIVLEAPDITIKAPGGFVRIDGGGVTIVGSHVWINSGGGAPSASGGAGGKPELPKEAVVKVPPEPEVDDVSKTGIGR
jgi:type VI secretion system secreted protein VgrG